MTAYHPVDTEQAPNSASSPSIHSRYDPYDTVSPPLKGSTMGSAEEKVIHSFPPRSSSTVPRRSIARKIVEILKSLILPLVAIGYLAFCYTVHKHIVPLKTPFVDLTEYRLSTVKSGVTAVSIMIIAIGLWPLRSLIQDLRSEEFIRVLNARKSGVPLGAINSISSPSFGTLDSLFVVIRRQCSSYFALSFMSGFVVLAVSTLAPAALSLETMLLDGDVVGLSVGAIRKGTIFNATEALGSASFGAGSAFTRHTQEATSIAWSEYTLDAQYMFKLPRNASDLYLVPTPASLSKAVAARWLSDVAHLRPTCTWALSNYSTTNIMVIDRQAAVFNPPYFRVPHFNIEVKLDYIWLNGSVGIFPVPPNEMRNYTTHDPSSKGYSVWLITSPYVSYDGLYKSVTINYGDIPIFHVDEGANKMQVAVLVCDPQYSVQTHEVRSTGAAELEVRGAVSAPQGNLNDIEMAWLLSYALSSLHDNGGPLIAFSQFGTELEAKLFFGGDQVSKFNNGSLFTDTFEWKFLPLANITDNYARLLQSASKPFTSGTMGTAYVPARIAVPTPVFTSSLPILIASTVLFALLSLMIVAAHFRDGKDQSFTLFRLATTLEGSGICRQLSDVQREHDMDDIRSLSDPWSTRHVVMGRKEDGYPQIHIQ